MGDSYSAGHAAVLAAQLPPQSRTMRSIDERLQWSQTDYLAALCADNLTFLRYENAKRAGAKGLEKPKPLERPGRRKKERRRGMSLPKEQLDELLFSPRVKDEEVDDG